MPGITFNIALSSTAKEHQMHTDQLRRKPTSLPTRLFYPSSSFTPQSWACGCVAFVKARCLSYFVLPPASDQISPPNSPNSVIPSLPHGHGSQIKSPCSVSHTGNSLESINVEGKSASQGGGWTVWGSRVSWGHLWTDGWRMVVQ